MSKDKRNDVYWIAVLLAGVTLGVVMGLALAGFAYPIYQSTEWAAWVQAVGAIVTSAVALYALKSWRIQQRERLVLTWKADILDYTYTLPYLEDYITYSNDKELVDKIAEKFYNCIKSYMLMIEYIPKKKRQSYELWWDRLHNAHNNYINGGDRDSTREVFTKVYLQKFL